MSEHKFKIGDTLMWYDYKDDYAIVKDVTNDSYIYDIYENNKLVAEDFKGDKTQVELRLYKLTKLHKALL